MKINASWEEIYNRIYAEEIALNNFTKFVTIIVFSVLLSFFLICFITSIALDRKKLETTGETFRITKRCVSWMFVVIASTLFYITLTYIPLRRVFIPTAVSSAIALLIAIALPFFNTHYIILPTPSKRDQQTTKTRSKS